MNKFLVGGDLMKKIIIGSITIVLLAGGYGYAMGPGMIGMMGGMMGSGTMGGHSKNDADMKDRQSSHDHSSTGEGDMKNGQSETDHHSMTEEHHKQMGHDETEMKESETSDYKEKGDTKNKGHEH